MMSFKEALNNLIQKNGIEVLNDKFKTRSFLSDRVGSNYYDNKLIEHFLLINCIFDLPTLFKKKGLKKGRDFLQEKYENFKYDITKKEYVDSINPISEIICPKEYAKFQKKKQM